MSQAEKSNAARPTINSNNAGSVVLTAYQGGPAIVHEDRHLSLPDGKSRVYIGGLPREFVENSSTIVAVRGDGKFTLGPKSLRPANLTVHAMLEQSIGSKITFIEESRTGEERKVSGTLVHIVDNRHAVLKEGDGEDVKVVPITNKFVLESGIPAGLSNLTVLVMDPKVERAGDFTVELLYETSGINWNPKYEAFYDADAGLLRRFACYVDVTNNSGANFEGAVLNLIAGVNVSEDAMRSKSRGMRMAAMPMAAAASLESAGGGMADFEVESAEVETVGEQKMYKLTEPVTLENGIPNSPVLVFCEDVPVEHEYHAYSQHFQQLDGDNKSDLPKLPVQVKLRVTNKRESKMGVALPPGSVRFFEPDSTGKLQKTDSSRVAAHVAEGEEFSLDLRNPSRDLKQTRELVYYHADPEAEETDENEDGPNFPIKPQSGDDDSQFEARPTFGPAVVRPIDRSKLIKKGADSEEKKPKPRFAEEKREVTLLNYKDVPVEVIVHENFPANAEFISGEREFTKLNATSGNGTVKVTVPARNHLKVAGSTTLSYHIRYRIN